MDATLSITAQLDLLGFSAHLASASGDLRTSVGTQAFARLDVLEKAQKLLAKEAHRFPNLLPSKRSFSVLRINDTLLMSLDIGTEYLPEIGQISPSPPSERIGAVTQRITGKGSLKKKDLWHIHDQTYGQDALLVAKFLAMVARTHNFVNVAESVSHFPGCRTVVASGVRYRRKRGTTDLLSANLSFANAYVTSQVGSKGGIGHNSLFLEDGVVTLVELHHHCKKLIYYAQFLEKFGSRAFSADEYGLRSAVYLVQSEPHLVTIFGKPFRFREVNSAVVSNLYLIELLTETLRATKPIFANGTIEAYVSGLKSPLKSLLELRSSNYRMDLPFFYFPWRLGENLMLVFRKGRG